MWCLVRPRAENAKDTRGVAILGRKLRSCRRYRRSRRRASMARSVQGRTCSPPSVGSPLTQPEEMRRQSEPLAWNWPASSRNLPPVYAGRVQEQAGGHARVLEIPTEAKLVIGMRAPGTACFEGVVRRCRGLLLMLLSCAYPRRADELRITGRQYPSEESSARVLEGLPPS